MKAAQSIQSEWLLVGTLRWDGSVNCPVWTDILHASVPPYKGVYAFIDSGGRIQKVGKTEDREGLRGRLRPRRRDPAKDATTRLWCEVWGRGAMAGRDVRVFFHPTPPHPHTIFVPGVGEVEVLLEWARDLERQLSKRARSEGEPMHLAGKGD